MKTHDEILEGGIADPMPMTSDLSTDPLIRAYNPASFSGPVDETNVTTHPASIPLVSTIFGLTYLALAVGKVPGLRIDRSGIALVGAAAMLGFGVLDLREAAKAVDYETLILLFGMMVVVAYLRLSGFFALATETDRRAVLARPGRSWR